MNWITTIEPAPHQIDGFHLGPLRFGHCLLMERFKTDEETVSPLDLWRWLNITSRTHQQARDWLTRDETSLFSISRWAFLTRMKKPSNFLKVATLWKDYIEENTATPEILSSTEIAESQGTPYYQSIWNFAVTRLNYSPSEIADAPFGQLLWALLAFQEQSGSIRIVDDNLSSVFDKLRCQHLPS